MLISGAVMNTIKRTNSIVFFLCFALTYGMEQKLSDSNIITITPHTKKLQLTPEKLNKLLFSGVINNDEKVITSALDMGADINVEDNQSTKETCLFKTDNPHTLEILLKRGATVDAINEKGYTPLFALLSRSPDKIDSARVFLQHGANPNHMHDNTTLLYYLVMRQTKLPIFELFLQYNADPNILNNNKQTPLHIAINRKSPLLIRFFIKNGADVNIPDSTKSYPIHHATDEEDFEFLKLLLERDVNINVPNITGHYPLHIAIQRKNINFVASLLANGADVNCIHRSGDTPLHMALPRFTASNIYDKKTIEIILLLLNSNTINPNVPYKNSKTMPIHIAVIIDNYDIVKKLLALGAKKDCKNDEGLTPFDIAQQFKHKPEKLALLNSIDDDYIDTEFTCIEIDTNNNKITYEQPECTKFHTTDDSLLHNANDHQNQSCSIQ